jgi:hypothetical protein
MVEERGKTREGWPVGVVTALTFLGAVLLILLFLRVDREREPLVERVGGRDVLAFEADVGAALSPVTIRPAHGLRVRGTRVVWRDDAGDPWLESPRITFSLQVGAALDGAIVIDGAVVESPRLRLVERAPGEWNFQMVLAPLLDPDRPRGPEPARPVRVRNLVVRNGDVVLARADATYRATDLGLVLASAVLAGPGVTAPSFHVSRADASVVLPDTADGQFTRRVALTDARIRLPDGAVAFDVATLTFGTSVATGLAGVWDPALGGLGLDARATIQRLALSDVPWLRAEVPEDAVASGDVRIQPLAGDRSAVALTGLSIRSETSTASGSLRVVVGPGDQLAVESVDLLLDPLALSLVEAFTGPLPYVGEVRGTIRGTADDLVFELRARVATTLAAERFTVDLRGRAALTELGADLRQLAVTVQDLPLHALEPLAPGLPFRGVVTGRITLDGLPDQVPLRLDVSLEAGGGIITIAGTVDLRGPEPAYDVTGRIIGVDLQRVLEPAVPPAQLHASFALAGRGVTLPTATAALRMDGRFTGWRAEPGDTLVLDARLAQGMLSAQQVRVDLGPVRLGAAGDWRFANGTGGAIRYSLVIESLEPLAPYLPGPDDRPRFARGALAAEGTLSGTLAAPALAGSVRASDFRYGDWAATSLVGDYDAQLGPGLPRLVADLTATDLRTPGGDFDTASLVLDFTRPAFAVRLDGERAGGLGVVQIEADGRLDQVGVSEVVLRTIELDLDQHRWRLPSPARIEWSAGDLVHVTDLRLEQVDGPGVVRLAGIIAPVDLTDLEIEIAALPVGDLLGLVRSDLAMAGDLWLTGTLRGPAETPIFDADAQLLNGAIRGVEVERLRAHVRFENQTLTAVGDGLLEDMASFELLAVLPIDLVLGMPPRAELIGDAPIRGELRAVDFALAALDPAIPAVRDLEGRLTADLILGGTPLDPILSGGASLSGGALTFQPLNQHYEGIEGEATLEGELLRVDRLVVRSDGTATLAGTVRFEDLANPVLDLVAEFRTFRAQGVEGRRDAAVTGRLAIGGTPASPLLSGNLRVDDGTVDMTRLQPPGAISDDLIGVAERFAPLGPGDVDLLEPSPTLVRISRLDLTAGSDLWFQSDEFRVQLAGDLIVQKPAEDVMILGSLTGTRGVFSLRVATATRRFDIVSSNIQFFGTPGPDPALDITAARIIPGPDRTDFELRIRLTGSLSAPAIAFATEDGTTIPESDALNFLIFGRATATLADFGGAGLGTTQTALDALAFYGAFDLVSAAVAEQFGAGIDYFQILVRGGTGEFGPELSFLLGHEVIDDVFVLVTLPTTEFEARWALTAEWRIDRQWTLEAGYEPPDLVIGIPGRRLPFGLEREQQLFVSIRRRWTY